MAERSNNIGVQKFPWPRSQAKSMLALARIDTVEW